MPRTTGTVKWFKNAKGFGFRVEVDVVQGEKGPAARNVVKL